MSETIFDLSLTSNLTNSGLLLFMTKMLSSSEFFQQKFKTVDRRYGWQALNVINFIRTSEDTGQNYSQHCHK